ncbi:MAG: hypothetical protein RIB60_05150 [Phycisphaerales bacterium]
MKVSIARRGVFAGVLLATVLAGASAVGLTRASQPAAAEANPPAEQIFERYIEAIGGERAVRSIRNRRIEGTFEGAPFGGTARLKVWADAPDKIHIQIREPLGMKLDIYYTGEYGWESIDGGEPRPIYGPRLVELAESAQFYGEAGYKDRYTEYETVGSGEYKGDPVWAVRAVSEAGRARRLFFDQATGLFVAEQSSVARLGESGSLEARLVEVGHANYTEIGGVLYPTRQTQHIEGDEKPIILDYATVLVNVDDEHEYFPPAEFRAKIEARVDEIRRQAEQARQQRQNSGG